MSFPDVLRDGSVTPGQHASFLGKAFDPFFVVQDPNRPGFRLPELSLPAGRKTRRCPGPSPTTSQVGLLVDQLLETAAVVEPAQGQTGGQAQLGQPEARPIGVLRR